MYTYRYTYTDPQEDMQDTHTYIYMHVLKHTWPPRQYQVNTLGKKRMAFFRFPLPVLLSAVEHVTLCCTVLVLLSSPVLCSLGEIQSQALP